MQQLKGILVELKTPALMRLSKRLRRLQRWQESSKLIFIF